MKRFWQIDAARGLAVIGMIAFNYAFALTFLGKASYPVESGPFWWFARAVAFSFVFLAGISLTLSYARSKKTLHLQQLTGKYLKRGIWIFFLGMLITLATWIYEPRATIWFGVLHLIGFAILISVPLIRIKNSTLVVLSVSAVAIGLFLNTLTFDFPYLLWLGFQPRNFYTFDYFPVFPWYGFFLFGIIAGRHFNDKKPAEYTGSFQVLISPLQTLGRNSLLIYLIHQPLLLLVLLLGGV